MATDRLSEQQIALLKKRLSEKAQRPCPMCGHNHLSVLDRLMVTPLQAIPRGLQLGGPALPSAVAVCENCGFTAMFNIAILGLGKEFGLCGYEEKEESNG